MNRPAPVAKCKVISNSYVPNALVIFTASNDVRQWINENAPQYGEFHAWRDGTGGSLYVNPAHNRDEVAAYLRTLGEE